MWSLSEQANDHLAEVVECILDIEVENGNIDSMENNEKVGRAFIETKQASEIMDLIREKTLEYYKKLTK